MTRPWTCPLCGWTITTTDTPAAVHAHGTITHPATLPPHTTIGDRLQLIPALAREAALTIGAPNPSGRDRAEHQHTARAHQPLPIDAGTLDALAPEDGDHPDRPLTMLVECSRIIWETLTPDQRQAHPQPVGLPTWRGECAWIADVWGDVQAQLDLADYDWIDSALHEITGTLANVARMQRTPRYLCPDCGWPMHLGETGWMLCEAGHQHPGPERLRDQWRRKPPMSTAHLAAQLHITTERIRKWHERGKLHPTRQEGRTLFWLPWDAVRCLYPAIVDAIESADQAS